MTDVTFKSGAVILDLSCTRESHRITAAACDRIIMEQTCMYLGEMSGILDKDGEVTFDKEPSSNSSYF